MLTNYQLLRIPSLYSPAYCLSPVAVSYSNSSVISVFTLNFIIDITTSLSLFSHLFLILILSRLKMSRSYISSLPFHLHGGSGTALLLLKRNVRRFAVLTVRLFLLRSMTDEFCCDV
jgi:hypothetical protein